MPITEPRRGLIRPAATALAAWAFALGAHAASNDLSPLARVEPEFPREAVSAGADKGHVRARMTIDRGGEVVRVEIIEANPRRLFDRVVVRSLSQWKFAPGSDGRSSEIDIEFRR
jgi:protein TonB